jgi:hypothetical protein
MPSSDRDDLIWYAAYGSNLDPARFDVYLYGGRPADGHRDYPGTRDAEAALATRPTVLPGDVVFGWDSPTWGGGVAFFDAEASGQVPATAYLLTGRQFSDVVDQEMWRHPGSDHDLAEILRAGRGALGPGRYETVHRVGDLDGHPVLTFTADELPELNAPAPGYLATMVRGLRAVHGLSDDAIVELLLARPGMRPGWDDESLRAIL